MKQKKIYIECIRILCIVTVLFCHRPANHSTDVITDINLSYCIKALISIVFRCNIPVFFMISGVLLIGREESVKKIFTKRVPRILIAMLLAYGMYTFCFPGMPELQDMIRPVNWFFYAYLGFLILLPVYRSIASCAKKETVVYYLLIMFITYTVYGVLMTGGYESEFIRNIFHYVNTDRWPNELWALMFPLTGWLILHLQDKGFTEKEQKLFWIITAVLSVLSVAAAFYFYLKAVRTENTLMRDGAQQYFLFAPACLCFEGFRRMFTKLEDHMGEKAKKAVSVIGASVFGVFMIEVQTPYSWLIYQKLEPVLVPVIGPYLPSAVSAVVEFVIYSAFICLLRLIPPVRKVL